MIAVLREGAIKPRRSGMIADTIQKYRVSQLMSANISYIFVFLICWFLCIFAIGAITAIPAARMFGYDLFDASTPIPIAIVATLCFFAVYHALSWGLDLHPPFLHRDSQVESQPVQAPARISVPPKLAGDSDEVTRKNESRTLFWLGILFSFPLGVLSSLLASWMYRQMTRR